MGSLLKVPIDWIDVEVQKQRGPNGVETRLGICHCMLMKFNNIYYIYMDYMDMCKVQKLRYLDL